MYENNERTASNTMTKLQPCEIAQWLPTLASQLADPTSGDFLPLDKQLTEPEAQQRLQHILLLVTSPILGWKTMLHEN